MRAEVLRLLEAKSIASRPTGQTEATSDDPGHAAAEAETSPTAPVPAANKAMGSEPIPESIGHYRIIRVIGEGGMGTVYEAEHLSTLNSINNMGYLLTAQGKLAEAESYYREALKTRRRMLGDEHPNTLLLINNMGLLLETQGKLAEAEPYYREELEIRRRLLGKDNPDTLNSIHNLAGLLRDQGEYDAAEALFSESVAGARAVLPETHTFRLITIGALGELRGDMGRHAEGETLLLESFNGLESTLGSDHARTQKIIADLIDLYTAWHEAEPGKGYDAKAEIWRAKLPQPEVDATPETDGDE